MYIFKSIPSNQVHLLKITYSKGRHETFSINPSVPSSIHGWHHIGKKTLAKINNPPPLRMCRCLGKACPAPVSGLLPWLAVCCYLMGHKQCKHQDFQRPRSRWIHVECDIQAISQVTSSANIKIFSDQGPDGYMQNVVYRLSHGSQAVQTSRFSMAKVLMDTCGMWYIERFQKCSLQL